MLLLLVVASGAVTAVVAAVRAYIVKVSRMEGSEGKRPSTNSRTAKQSKQPGATELQDLGRQFRTHRLAAHMQLLPYKHTSCHHCGATSLHSVSGI